MRQDVKIHMRKGKSITYLVSFDPVLHWYHLTQYHISIIWPSIALV